MLDDYRLQATRGHAAHGEHFPLPGAIPALDAGTDWHTALLGALCGRTADYRPLRHTGSGVVAGALVGSARAAAAAIAGGAAVVSPLSPDLVVMDLDGCAVPAVLDGLDAAAVEHGARLAYRALSGSVGSEHRAYVVPWFSWSVFRRAAAAVVELHRPPGAVRWTLDDRTADDPDTRRGHGLRLPFSPALKQGGGLVVPVGDDGTAVSLETATRRVWSARLHGGLRAVHGYWNDPVSPSSQSAPKRRCKGPTGDERAEREQVAESALTSSLSACETVPRRACESALPLPGDWTANERELLQSSPPVGSRSDVALRALRAVVRRCGWSWSSARAVVMSSPVFAKYSGGGEHRARRWWQSTTDDYAAWLHEHGSRGERAALEVTDDDRAAVSAWWSAAWPLLVERFGVARAARAFTVALFIGERRLLDGRGLEDRPVAVRDLVVWGAVSSVMTASRALADLECTGLLECTGDYDLSAPLEARRWSVPGALTCRGTETVHGCLQAGGSSLTGPALAHLPAPARVLLWHLAAAPAVSSALVTALRCSARSVTRWLDLLESSGLVAVDSAGCWSAVRVVGRVLSAAAAVAVERLESVRVRVAAERVAWRGLWSRAVDGSGRLSWRFCPWLSPSSRRGAPV